MVLAKNETGEDYITERLYLIHTCQQLITALERKAVDNPDLSQEIGEAIRGNKDIIKQYEGDIRALLD